LWFYFRSLLKKNPGCSVWWTGSCPICSSSDRLSVGGSCDHCEIRKSQNNEVYSKQIGLSFVGIVNFSKWLIKLNKNLFFNIDPDTIHEPKVLLNTSKEKPPNPKKVNWGNLIFHIYLSIYIKQTVCTYLCTCFPFSTVNCQTNLHQILHRPPHQLGEDT